jgi:hypothetical protein
MVSIESVLTEYVEGRAHAEESDQLRVKAIGALWQDNPLGFLVREDGPESLEDLFTGNRPDGSRWRIGATPDAILIEAIADYYDVSYDDLNLITTGYDAAAFLADQVDALWGFWTTQAYQAYVAGIPYRFLTLSTIPGLAQPSNIILTEETTLNDEPELLVSFFEASLRGARFTLENPETAAEYVLDPRCGGSDLDRGQELWLIQQSLPLYSHAEAGSCIGVINPADVSAWAETYLSITENPNVPTADSLVDMRVLEAIYDADELAACLQPDESE